MLFVSFIDWCGRQITLALWLTLVYLLAMAVFFDREEARKFHANERQEDRGIEWMLKLKDHELDRYRINSNDNLAELRRP